MVKAVGKVGQGKVKDEGKVWCGQLRDKRKDLFVMLICRITFMHGAVVKYIFTTA